MTATANITEQELRVHSWRFEQCLQAGYSHGQAGRIAADPRIELEAARKLRRLGCPPALALEILT